MKRNRTQLQLVAAIILFIVLGCNDEEGDRKKQALKDDRASLNAAVGELTKLPAKEQLTAEPYIKGKVAVFTKNETGSYSMIQTDLIGNDDGYARTPDEAQTVILKACYEKRHGLYRTNENPPRELPAYSSDCDVTVIDRSIPAVVFKKRFEANMKDDAGVTKDTKEVRASVVYEISDFIKSLPRR